MGLTSYIAIGIAFVVLTMVLLMFKADKKDIKRKPHLLSWLALCLIILNWVLYLFGFYAMLPQKIGNPIFIPIWFLVCIISFIAAVKEFRNNRIFAIVSGGLSVLSSIFGVLILIIGSM